MLSSSTISVLLITVRSLSRKGLFGKLLSNVVVSLMKSFVNVALASWCFCFFSCVVEDSSSSNSSIIRQSSGPHNSHLTNAESSCRLMREFAPLDLIQCRARESFIGLQKREVSCCEFFILARTTVSQQFHIKPINSCTTCIIVSI